MKIRIIILFLCLVFFGIISAEAYSDHRNRKVDSLEHVLKTAPPTGEADLIRLYDGLAWGYLETNEQKSMRYADLGLGVAEKIKAYKSINNFHRIKGMHHWGNARYAEAEHELNLALEAVDMMHKSGNYDEVDVDDQASALYGTFGNLYNTLGQGAKALEYYFKALRLFEKHEWRESQSLAYSNMADLYYFMGNLSHAMDFYHRGDSIARLTNDALIRTYAERGMAKVCMQKEDYEKAWECINRVYDYVSSHQDEEGSSLSECLFVMTDIAIAENDWAKVEKLISQVESVETEYYQNLSAFYCQKAKLCVHRNDYTQAERYALQARALNTDAPDKAREVFKLLADIYSHLGEPEKAKVFMNKADSIQTSWSNYAYQASLSEEEVRFETEKKDMTISSLSTQKQVMIAIVSLCVVLLILLCAMYVIIRRNHQRQKDLIAARVTLETETRERQIIAKDLHDGLGGMLSLLKLKIKNQEQDAAMQLVDESAREMRRVAHHIMPAELQTKGLVSSLSDFAISVPGAHFHYFSTDENSETIGRLPKEIELVLYRCAYELVNNAIKHASAERIDIQLMKEESQVTLTISDNGCGFVQTDENNGGMGLKNIRNRISQYNGKMNLLTTPGEGTEINITMPV